MDKVRARPNHYEMLGLKPGAGADEIAPAFARQLRRPGTIGEIARLSIAYETLRDAGKRRAYDASIGLGQQPEQLHQWSGGALFGSRYMRTAAAVPAKPPVATPGVSPAPPQPRAQRPPEHKPEALADPRLPSFLASALRDIARPEPLHSAAGARPQPDQPTHWEADSPGEPPAAGRAPPFGQIEFGLAEVEEGTVDWRRTGLAAGALIAVAGMLGVWAGSEASNDTVVQPQTVGTPRLRPAAPFPRSIADAPTAAATVRSALADQPSPAAVAPLAVAHATPAPRPVAQAVKRVELAAEVEASEAAPPTAEEAPAELVAAAVKAAAMPLPNRVIARTIERIGYSCGEVASTAAVDGGVPGVFTVSCTSGQAFQARPVRGRYRFRRLGRQ